MGQNRVIRRLEKLAALKTRLVSSINTTIAKDGFRFYLLTSKQIVLIKWVYLSKGHGFYGVECILRDYSGFHRRLVFISKDGIIQDAEYYQLRNFYKFGILIYTI
jgi:hypothetical protein